MTDTIYEVHDGWITYKLRVECNEPTAVVPFEHYVAYVIRVGRDNFSRRYIGQFKGAPKLGALIREVRAMGMTTNDMVDVGLAEWRHTETRPYLGNSGESAWPE